MTIPLTLRRASAHTHRRSRQPAGFTLTEILIAIALIVTIVAVAVGGLSHMLEQGKVSATQIFVKDGVKTPLQSYQLSTGHFPTTEQGLQALISQPDGESNWHGPYFDDQIKELPLDPWGFPYHYLRPGVHNPMSYDVWSNGASGADGAPDTIGNW